MQNYLLTTVLLAIFSISTNAQSRYAGEAFKEYYMWFHEYSQTADQFISGSTLITFTADTPIHQSPSHSARVITNLPIAHPINNTAIPVVERTTSSFNGYSDHWLSVSGCDDAGKTFQGYVWGGFVAKGWRHLDLNGNEENDLILLGVSQTARAFNEGIAASVRVIIDNEIAEETEIEGFCVFEECNASTLLRILNSPTPSKNHFVIEASVLTSGCLTGIDKAFLSWDGHRLAPVYQAEFKTGYEYANSAMYLPVGTNQTQICYFSHEDASYNPVWKCETITATGRASIASNTNQSTWAKP